MRLPQYSVQYNYAVGNVNAAGLAKTKMAKSVLDASWSGFRTMLAYKSVREGAWYEEDRAPAEGILFL